jgi:arylsulfatase A-like enzyme
MARIDAELAKAGELENTIVVFISDNGFYYGEHRLTREKIRPYEEALRIPFAMRVPPGLLGAPTVPSTDQLVGNTDLVPTLLELAGAQPCLNPGKCRVMDGRSLVPLLLGQGGFPQDRALAVEWSVSNTKFNTTASCEYHGVRTAAFLFVEHTRVPTPPDGQCVASDERELYDLAADPFQLQNLYPAPAGSPAAAVQASLAERTARLASCAGIEGRDPAPASGNYCE